MTQKIYEEDVLCRECSAVVTDCHEMKKGFAIELDRTVFFPEGGGQLSDTGVIEHDGVSVRVRHVRSKDGHILHETAESIDVGTKVMARIDWQTRFDHMQQHCGEHLLSYAFWKLFNANNIGFHESEDMVTIDLDKKVTQEDTRKAEAMANRDIERDLKVKAEWMPHDEAAKLNTRKFNHDIKGSLRIVSVEDSDICTCCGTHPPRTGMVGLVKVFRIQSWKGGTRVYFLCGRQALDEIGKRLDALSKASNLLSIKDEEIEEGTERLINENKELIAKLHAMEESAARKRALELVQSTAACDDGTKRICVIEDDMPARDASLLAKAAAEDDAAAILVVYKDGGRIGYIAARGSKAKGSCRDDIRMLGESLSGRGGGRDSYAQGSAQASDGWREKAKTALEAWKGAAKA